MTPSDSQSPRSDQRPPFMQRVRQWWEERTGGQKLATIAGSIIVIIALVMLMARMFGGDEDSSPAPIEAIQRPAATQPDSQPRESTPRSSRPTAKPRPDSQLTDEVKPQHNVPTDNSNDSRAIRATYVLDDVVNDPSMSLSGFDDISKRLNDEASLTADQSIQDTFQMLEYASGNNEFASRASQPNLIDKGNGTYVVEYDVAGALAPKKRDSNGSSLKQRIGSQMEDALSSGVSMPVSFTINFNSGNVSISTPRWW